MPKKYGETISNYVHVLKHRAEFSPSQWHGIEGGDRLYTIKRKALDRLFRAKKIVWRAGTGRNHIEYKARAK